MTTTDIRRALIMITFLGFLFFGPSMIDFATAAPAGPVISSETGHSEMHGVDGKSKIQSWSRTCRQASPTVKVCVKITDTVTTSAKGNVTHTHTETTTTTPKGGKSTTITRKA